MNKPKKRKTSGPGFVVRHSMSILIAGIAATLIVISAAIFCFQGYSGQDAGLHFVGGQTSEAVKDSLKAKLGSAMGFKVYLLWRLQGGDADALRGGYVAHHGQSAFSIGRALAKGRQTPVRVTFNNVRTMEQLAERITRNIDATPQEFLEACDSVLRVKGFKPEEYPAAFLPDTYEVYWTVTPAELVGKLVGIRNKFWSPERMAKADALGLLPVEVATLASIVEEETAKADERPKVARLYLNRLARGMKLQADPTVKFATGNFAARRINSRMLSFVSPYNTYRVNGLPPGPIRIPEGATIDAVLDAPRHPYIYMCAREDFSGYHNFATDYATHSANARRYQAELDRRDIH